MKIILKCNLFDIGQTVYLLDDKNNLTTIGQVRFGTDDIPKILVNFCKTYSTNSIQIIGPKTFIGPILEDFKTDYDYQNYDIEVKSK